ncbi:uncharacterized protein BO80DRAFT_195940 [Aspergillus ibericus CBS 121593]|uniref:Uncharacterized protein n=1 Tax=Aspergillus ibericus CBS 121593 TaxID=1448316 RepID=A0A395GT27_9EURO|nr:hypothetical protein BO80DRAFT_195940 [Aspergillus ibericus CBS 121593]RAK97243.1 hypothetical protein BO80DRAFT_195940 [Aspergillus ibericus CBS 121593]
MLAVCHGNALIACGLLGLGHCTCIFLDQASRPTLQTLEMSHCSSPKTPLLGLLVNPGRQHLTHLLNSPSITVGKPVYPLAETR